MIVTFVSQCQKKSLDITRQVLDAYANRIGERTWQTVITQEGLNAVRSRLAKTARKTTAVSCHRMRGTSRTELVWIVGNRRQFDEFGNVPVNRTQRDLLTEDKENDWQYLQLIKVLVALSALFHDFGKSWDHFQEMLKGKQRDPIRHEWVSLLLFKALVNGKTDIQWLDELVALKSSDLAVRKAFVQRLLASPEPTCKDLQKPFRGMSDFSAWLGWLIVSHHHLPKFMGKNDQDHPFGNGDCITTPQVLLKAISLERSGYLKADKLQDVKIRWEFSNDLPILSAKWCKAVARWAERAKSELAVRNLAEIAGAERLFLTLARLTLMLGDHQYSSQEAERTWDTTLNLYANTGKSDEAGKRPLKQKLDEHLVRVADAALKVGHLLPAFEKELPRAYDIRALLKPSPKAFAWQNKAIQAIKQWKKDHRLTENGFFAINMASTGKGKTFANAKVMYALSDDESLRYTLALGLRTLTLQTGDEYRDKIFGKQGASDTDLAVLIGSTAVKFLYEQRMEPELPEAMSFGSDSARFLDESLVISGGNLIPDSILETLFDCRSDHGKKLNKKKRQLLDTPIVVSTIDHLMPATEGVRGGQQILPTLRLMSADLVIDEVDDFDKKDQPAITRLVHLAGMLGRKVMISSATIPPAIAEGLFHAYQQGWKIFAVSRQRKPSVAVFWLDEFNSALELIPAQDVFQSAHQRFISKRLAKLATEPAKRKAELLPLQPVTGMEQSQYFDALLTHAIALHRRHNSQDEETGVHLSIGVIRLANINPCIQLMRHLLDCTLPDDVEIRVMVYHSRQVLLLRSALEVHLDEVLNRKGEKQPQSNARIKRHLRACQKSNLIFILVASPVEEVGRDHDLDWAVIEPSSLRSIIQMAGRVWRHRDNRFPEAPNLVLPEYNLKGYLGQGEVVFCRPGYESKDYRLNSHSLAELLDMDALAEKVDAAPRIRVAEHLQPHDRLADLEHRVLQDIMTKQDYRPETVNGWIHSAFYLSQLAQKLSPFRQSEPDSTYKLHVDEEGSLTLRTPDKDGRGKEQKHVHITMLDTALKARLWLPLDYSELIEKQMKKRGKGRRSTCEFLGEIRLKDQDGDQPFEFIPELGFYRND